MADVQRVKLGIKEKPASRAFQSNYSRIAEFVTPAVNWAPKLLANGMISRSSFELATNQAAFVAEQSKAIQMLQDLERYIRSSNADLFWHLVYMINEKERAQEGGGTLAQKLAVAYKNKGGGDEIDSALSEVSDHKHDGPERCLSQQPTSNVPPHPDSTARSQSDPLSVGVQESPGGTQGVRMLITPSPVENNCPSLPLGQQEQGAGSLEVRLPEEERGTVPQEVSEENRQQYQPPKGDSPSPPPSSLPQVGGAQVGRAQGDGAQVGGAHGGGVPEDGVVRRNANDKAEKKPRNDQHTAPKSAASSPSRAEGVAYKKNGGGDEIDSALIVPREHHNTPERLMSEQPPSRDPHPDSTLLPARQDEPSNGTQDVPVTSSPVESRCRSLYATFAGYATSWRDVLVKYTGPLAVGAFVLLLVAIVLGVLSVGKS